MLVVLVPQHFASAAGTCNPLNFDIAGCAVQIFNIPLYIIAWLLGFVAGLLNDFITATGTVMIPAVRESWTILRDFVNMLFILVLIIMAFGTIFDIKKYTWREMLVPFLIAALLINFSFVIGEYIISIGNGLSGIFLKQIGTINLADRIGQGLGMQKIITSQGKDLTGTSFSAIGAVASTYQQLITMVFFIVFGAIALMALIAAFIFVFIRIPILWFLLIVSPIAWFGYMLPNLKSETWDRWWHEFIRWVFFLPAYLFFLMFGFIFIAAKNNTSQLVRSATLGQSALILVNDIAFYVVTLIFLAGGLWASFKVGGKAGSNATKLMGGKDGKGGIQGFVRKYMPGAAYVRGAFGGWRKGEEPGGLKLKYEEIKEKGVFGIGGAQRMRMAEAETRELFAFGATRGAAEKQLVEEVNKLKGQFEKISDASELRKLANAGPKHQQLAAREVLQNREELTVDEQLAAYRLYGGKDSLAAQKFAKGIDFARLSSEERGRLYDAIDDPEIKRKVINTRADKGDLKNANVEELRKYATLFVQEGDQREFLNKALKFAFEESIKAQVELKLIKDSAGNPVTDVVEAIAEKVRKMKLDDIFELSKGSLQKLVQENPEAARIIAVRLNKENIASIPGKVDSDRMDILEGMLTKRKGELEAEETERQQKSAAIQGEAQVKAMQPLVNAIKELMEAVRK